MDEKIDEIDQPKYTRKIDLPIYETNEYDKFKFLSFNRKMTLNSLLESIILDDNLLKYNPIIVTKDFEVLDGQHRLSICKENKLPIYYIINTEHKSTVVQKLNIASKLWKLDDHLHFFVEQGIESYVIFERLSKIAKINPSCLIQVLGQGNTTTSTRRFKSGEFKLRYDEKSCAEMLERYKEIDEKMKYYTHSTGCSAAMQFFLLKFLLREDYNHYRFLKNIDRCPDTFVKCNLFSKEENIKDIMIDNIYNKYHSAANHITY